MKKIITSIGLLFGLILLSKSFGESNGYDVDDFNITHSFCQKANNITEDEMDTFVSALKRLGSGESSEINADKIYAEIQAFEMKIKCYSLCLFDQMEILDSNDKIDVERVRAIDDIGEDSIEVVNECKAAHDGEEHGCEYGFKMLSCFVTDMINREKK